MDNVIKISKLSDMESIISRINKGEEILIESLDFSGLKNLQIKIYGDEKKYNGTLPASLCYGLCDFQNELLKTYALIKYKTDNLRYLKSGDRELLDVVFEIKPGCTDLLAGLTEFTTACGDAFAKMTHGMTGTQKTSCMILLILSLAGGVLTYSHIEAKHDEAIQQIEANKAAVKDKSENERMVILRDGIMQAIDKDKDQGGDAAAIAAGIKEHSAKAYEGILKPVTDADKVEVNGVAGKIELSQKQVQEFVSNPVEKPEHKDRVIAVEIDGIKRSPDKLTINCHEVGSESGFVVYVDLSFVEPEEVSLLFDAFKKSSVIKIQGNFKVRSGIIEQGNLSSVTE
ncbi:Uncharacterised protein [Yersinia aldovae]|uniref:hypothetical protein n=1 Tax=Yersinia aldovae TaxID=29483 RepID=UPI0005DB8DB4|nr:hypothetical protein [Yersinia aldovae]CNJ17967.1 Uncharacterised protein [Yersinia aldovae]